MTALLSGDVVLSRKNVGICVEDEGKIKVASFVDSQLPDGEKWKIFTATSVDIFRASSSKDELSIYRLDDNFSTLAKKASDVALRFCKEGLRYSFQREFVSENLSKQLLTTSGISSPEILKSTFAMSGIFRAIKYSARLAGHAPITKKGFTSVQAVGLAFQIAALEGKVRPGTPSIRNGKMPNSELVAKVGGSVFHSYGKFKALRSYALDYSGITTAIKRVPIPVLDDARVESVCDSPLSFWEGSTSIDALDVLPPSLEADFKFVKEREFVQLIEQDRSWSRKGVWGIELEDLETATSPPIAIYPDQQEFPNIKDFWNFVPFYVVPNSDKL